MTLDKTIKGMSVDWREWTELEPWSNPPSVKWLMTRNQQTQVRDSNIRPEYI